MPSHHNSFCIPAPWRCYLRRVSLGATRLSGRGLPTSWVLWALIVVCLLGLPGLAHAEERKQAVNGFLDLTAWGDFRHGNAVLDGEWEFYWGQFVEPHKFSQPGLVETPVYMQVPGSWKGIEVDGSPLPGEGFGTYRLRVQLHHDSGAVGLYVPQVLTSYALWVNGELVAGQGMVGREANSSRPGAEHVVVGLGPNPGEIDIVLHVANFAFREGGLSKSVLLGNESRIVRDMSRSLAIEVFLVATLLVIGLYHLAIWALQPRNRHSLYFGLMCSVVALRTSAMDQTPLTLFLPWVSWEATLKIEYLGFYLGLPLLVLFLRSLFPKEFSPRFVSPLLVLSAGFSLFVLMTPGRTHSHALAYFEVLAVISFLFMTWGLIQANRHGREGARLILVGAAVVFLVVVHDMLVFWRWFESRPLTPAAILALVLAYSFMLSKRFADEIEAQRALTAQNAKLVETVQEQVAQIRDAQRLMNDRDEQTRQEVAEMLHGTVQSRLLSARHYLLESLGKLTNGTDRIEPEAGTDAIRMFRKAKEQIEATRADLRAISHLLHPILIQLGILPALHELSERFADHFAIRLHVGDGFTRVEDQLGEEGVDKEVRLAVYRIVEEALNNAVKHAQATAVEIFLDVIDGTVGQVVISDNGQGMQLDGLVKGLGLQMVATRVEDLGGTWSLSSAPGQGTRIEVRVPFVYELYESDADNGFRNHWAGTAMGESAVTAGE